MIQNPVRYIAMLLLTWSSCCAAVQIVFESLETVLEKTQQAIVVELLYVSEIQNSGNWRAFTFQASPIKTLFGTQETPSKINCHYSQGMPHLRGDMVVWPLVSGSGFEFDVKRGNQVIFLIDNVNATSGQCNVLRIETLPNEKFIADYERPGK